VRKRTGIPHASTYHCQFERSRFEPHVSARRVAQHETKIDVNQMTLPIDQDVSVMSILDLQQKGDDTISRKRFDEIPLSLGEAPRIRFTISLSRDRGRQPGTKRQDRMRLACTK
jgi:hypothetical protein